MLPDQAIGGDSALPSPDLGKPVTNRYPNRVTSRKRNEMKRTKHGAIVLSNVDAKLLFQRFDRRRNEWVVMATYLNKYVTWIAYANETTGEYDPEHGNYFTNKDKAYQDFMTR